MDVRLTPDKGYLHVRLRRTTVQKVYTSLGAVSSVLSRGDFLAHITPVVYFSRLSLSGFRLVSQRYSMVE